MGSLGGSAARLCRSARAAGESGECREDRPDRSLWHLRLELSGPVLREHALPSLAAPAGWHSEAAPGGSHDDLRAHSGHLHPLLLARAGRRLAGGIAWHDLGPCSVRHPTQALLDGGPALALSGALPGNGLDRCDRGSRPLPGGSTRRDDLGVGRGPTLHRGSAYLRAETPEPNAWSIRVPRAVAPLRRGRKRLPFLGSAALRRAARLERFAEGLRPLCKPRLQEKPGESRC